jgi:hypothetical protein
MVEKRNSNTKLNSINQGSPILCLIEVWQSEKLNPTWLSSEAVNPDWFLFVPAIKLFVSAPHDHARSAHGNV